MDSLVWSLSNEEVVYIYKRDILIIRTSGKSKCCRYFSIESEFLPMRKMPPLKNTMDDSTLPGILVLPVLFLWVEGDIVKLSVVPAILYFQLTPVLCGDTLLWMEGDDIETLWCFYTSGTSQGNYFFATADNLVLPVDPVLRGDTLLWMEGDGAKTLWDSVLLESPKVIQILVPWHYEATLLLWWRRTMSKKLSIFWWNRTSWKLSIIIARIA